MKKQFIQTILLSAILVFTMSACNTDKTASNRYEETVVIENISKDNLIYVSVEDNQNEKLLLKFMSDLDLSRLNVGSILDVEYVVLEESNPLHVEVYDYNFVVRVLIENLSEDLVYVSVKDNPNTKLLLSFTQDTDFNELEEGMEIEISYKVKEETNPLLVEVQEFNHN